MIIKICSAAIVGLDAEKIEVEVDAFNGMPRFTIVGLPDKAVEESKERVVSAIKSAKLRPPHWNKHRVLVNLAPADLQKQGSLYDLAIALGYLLCSEQAQFNPQNKMFAGELALDGTLRPIKGAISFALLAEKSNCSELILPKANAEEASLVVNPCATRGAGSRQGSSLKIIGAESLRQVIAYLEGRTNILPVKPESKQFAAKSKNKVDLSWIKGQHSAKRALEIAAAGGHNLMMYGPPGTGKSLLAKALPSILPKLSFEETLEVTKIYSIAGLLPEKKPLIGTRPFRSPHHTASETALIGGGNPPRAGEITLSHRGVLFLDEFPEFHRDALESLRQPLEDGEITISRAQIRLTLPAKIMLVAASNPCPCGYFKDPDIECSCPTSSRAKYQRKLSGPLMDRMDLFVHVPKVKYEKLTSVSSGNASFKIRQKIEQARQIQKQRFHNSKLNSEMNILEIKKYCPVDVGSETLLRKFVNSGRLSARGYHRILKVSRTIADLDNSANILHDHLTEALAYRTKNALSDSCG